MKIARGGPPGDGGGSAISGSEVETWVPRGLAVVHSESPGTGRSQGCPSSGGANESLAPKAVIDWLNGRARGFTSATGNEEVRATWSTGKVGMTGTSYNGALAIAAASTGVEGLAAIIPISPVSSWYHYYRSNGLVRNPGGYPGEDMDVLYDFVNSGDPARRGYCNRVVRDSELVRREDRATGDYNDFWASRDYLASVDKMKAAMLIAHGLNDWNTMPEQSIRIYEALAGRKVPVQLYLHQGEHGGPPPLEQMNRWFTRFLYGVTNDVERAPRAWIVREDGNASEPQPYADYPNPAAAPVILQPDSGGAGSGGLRHGEPRRAGA
jgi:X-Pro dipeptidyl-peptidase